MIENLLKMLDKWLTIDDKCPFVTKKDFCSIGKYKGRCLYEIHYESCPDYQINKEGVKE